MYELNVVSFNLPVPIGSPFKEIEPVILTLPVNLCVSFNVSPNTVDPLAYSITMLVTEELRMYS